MGGACLQPRLLHWKLPALFTVPHLHRHSVRTDWMERATPSAAVAAAAAATRGALVAAAAAAAAADTAAAEAAEAGVGAVATPPPLQRAEIASDREGAPLRRGAEEAHSGWGGSTAGGATGGTRRQKRC